MRDNYRKRLLICVLSIFVFSVWTIQTLYGIFNGVMVNIGLLVLIPIIFFIIGLFLWIVAIKELVKILRIGKAVNNQIPLDKFDNSLFKAYIEKNSEELELKEHNHK